MWIGGGKYKEDGGQIKSSTPHLNLLNTTLPIITHLWVLLLRCQLSMELVPAWESDYPLIVPSQSDLWLHFQKPTADQTSPAPECDVWETRDSCEFEVFNELMLHLRFSLQVFTCHMKSVMRVRPDLRPVWVSVHQQRSCDRADRSVLLQK